MWICLNDTFLSIVHKDCGPDELLVRARRDGDIERVFPGAQVRVVPGHDYRCRATVARADVVEAITKRVLSLDYPNFKDSTHDHALHRAYMDVWAIMGRLQPGGPYGAHPHKS